MLFRRSAWLILVVALLAQFGAPLTGAAATAVADTEAGVFCLTLHDDGRGPDAPKQTSGDGSRHHHSLCSLCAASSGAVSVAIAPICVRRDVVALAARFAVTTPVYPTILKHDAAPRAPPFRV